MYVDVVACKRERIKVDVTLAKRSAARIVPAEPIIVSIPVKVAVPTVEDTAEKVEIIDVVDELGEEIAEEIELEASALSETVEQSDEESAEEATADTVEELIALTGAEADEAAEIADVFAQTDSTPDEDLSAIDELLAGADNEITEEVYDDIVADALDELDDMNRRADVMRERLDGQLAKELEKISDSADEESEELTNIIGKELESLDNVLSQREKASENAEDEKEAESEGRAAEQSSYMRYFDRDNGGDRVEVSRDEATGQEVVCYDEVSGKLSRVCGIIRKDGEIIEDI